MICIVEAGWNELVSRSNEFPNLFRDRSRENLTCSTCIGRKNSQSRWSHVESFSGRQHEVVNNVRFCKHHCRGLCIFLAAKFPHAIRRGKLCKSTGDVNIRIAFEIVSRFTSYNGLQSPGDHLRAQRVLGWISKIFHLKRQSQEFIIAETSIHVGQSLGFS